MGLIDPKSPQGATAWDYGNALVHELKQLRRAVEESQGKDPQFRRIAFSIATDGTGAGVATVSIPRGVRWTPVAANIASLSGTFRAFVNSTDNSGLLSQGNLANINSLPFADNERVTHNDQAMYFTLTGSTDINVTIYGNIRVLQFEDSPNDPLNAN